MKCRVGKWSLSLEARSAIRTQPGLHITANQGRLEDPNFMSFGMWHSVERRGAANRLIRSNLLIKNCHWIDYPRPNDKTICLSATSWSPQQPLLPLLPMLPMLPTLSMLPILPLALLTTSSVKELSRLFCGFYYDFSSFLGPCLLVCLRSSTCL